MAETLGHLEAAIWIGLPVAAGSTLARFAVSALCTSPPSTCKPSNDAADVERSKRRDNIVEESWLMLTSTCLMALSTWASCGHNANCTLLDQSGCFTGWPRTPNSSQVAATLAVFLGWYIHCLVKNLVPGVGGQHAGTDMVYHHFLTIGLFGAAHAFNLQRAGLVILALLNLSSPFMHAAKIAHHIGTVPKLKAGLFLLFAAAFAIARCIQFPQMLFTMSSEAVSRHQAGEPGVLAPAVVCLSGLYLLQVLQFYWMWKIVKVILRGKVDTDTKSTPSPAPADASAAPVKSVPPLDTREPANLRIADASTANPDLAAPIEVCNPLTDALSDGSDRSSGDIPSYQPDGTPGSHSPDSTDEQAEALQFEVPGSTGRHIFQAGPGKESGLRKRVATGANGGATSSPGGLSGQPGAADVAEGSTDLPPPSSVSAGGGQL